GHEDFVHLMLEQGLVVGHGTTPVPTVGCYLLFGRNVADRFPYARVTFTRGSKKRIVFEGNLITQFRKLVDHITSDEVNPTLRIKGERSSDESPAYPRRALVELAVNMLVHRDYEADGHAHISFEPGGSLSFLNPGGLMSGVLRRVQIAEDG